MDLPQAALPYLSLADFDYVVNRAIVFKSRTAVQRIALSFQLLVHEQERPRFILSLLGHAGPGLLLPATIQILLEELQKTAHVGELQVQDIVRFNSNLFVPRTLPEEDSEAFSSVLQTLAHTLVRALPNTSSFQPDSTSVAHKDIFTALSHILFRLCHFKRDHQVLDVLSAMVRQRKLGASILQDALSSMEPSTEPSHETFRKVVITTLVKAWAQWQMYPAAAKFFRASFPQTASSELGLDVLRESLNSTTPEDINAASDVLRTLMKHQKVPLDIVHRFYEQARAASWPSAAQEVYQCATDNWLRDGSYLPRGKELQWLLSWLVSKERNLPLARAFGWEIANNNVELELPIRGDLIYQLAKSGMALPARILWEKYSTGEDGKAVTGHRAAMVKLVNLFTTMASAADTRKSAESTDAPSGMDDTLDVSAEVSDREKLDRFCAKIGEWRPYFASDFMAFARRVVQAFRDVKEPLEESDHKDLTSLARAYSLIGQRKTALKVLRIGSERKELPDLYDVNVALAAIAQNKPRDAARMLRRMLHGGLMPDRYSVGPIVNHAVKHNDLALVRWVVSWARWLDKGVLDITSINSIITGALGDREDVKGLLERNLRRTWEVSRTLAKEGLLPTVGLGIQCVRLALEAGGAGLAYLFWRTLVCDRDGPDDHHQLRRQIAVAVAMAVKEGSMRSAVGRRLLERLAQRRRAGRRRYGYQYR